MQSKRRSCIRPLVLAGLVGIAPLMGVNDSAAATCVGRVAGLGTGTNGVTVGLTNTCEEQCSGGIDVSAGDPALNRMLAVLLSAQARVAIVTVSYDVVDARCRATSVAAN